MITRLATGVAALALPLQLAAQQPPPITLAELLARADRANYSNTMAAAEAEGAESGALAAMRGILPSLRFEGGYARTTDPIGVFGTTLRQRQIAQQDFNPQSLNFPDPVTNYAAGVVVEAPLLNADAHVGRKAASRAVEAARASATWTRMTTRMDVIRAYFGAVLAAEKVVTLQTALKAAQAHVRQAELSAKAGLVTRSDALFAQVKAGEVETSLLEAEGGLRVAQHGLAILAGEPDSLYLLPQNLPEVTAIRSLLAYAVSARRDAESRADVVAAKHAAAAAGLDATRALSLYLPRLNAVARYDWNSATRLYGGDNSWTVGVMASWSPFAGAAEVAERRAANARDKTAETGLAAANAHANHEVTAARVEHDVAARRLEIAERALHQSIEAHRIISRKYEGGIASVVELLDAAALETATRLAFSNARFLAISAAANLLKASGNDPAVVAQYLPLSTVGID